MGCRCSRQRLEDSRCCCCYGLCHIRRHHQASASPHNEAPQTAGLLNLPSGLVYPTAVDLQESASNPGGEDNLENQSQLGGASGGGLVNSEQCKGHALSKVADVEDQSTPKKRKGGCSLDSISLLLVEDDSCPICLDEYDSENPKIVTACEHHFHLGCILEWMERSDTCPMCDKEMVFEESL